MFTVPSQSGAASLHHEQDRHRDNGTSQRNLSRHDSTKEASPKTPACEHTDRFDGW